MLSPRRGSHFGYKSRSRLGAGDLYNWGLALSTFIGKAKERAERNGQGGANMKRASLCFTFRGRYRSANLFISRS